MPLKIAVEMNAPRQDANALESADSESVVVGTEIVGNFMLACRTVPSNGRNVRSGRLYILLPLVVR
jgi:hypothetical protein